MSSIPRFLHRMMKDFPDDMRELITRQTWIKNHDGMTDAQIFISDHYVIKIIPIHQEALHERYNYQHFSHHDWLPDLIYSVDTKTHVVLLTKRLQGHMLTNMSHEIYLDVFVSIFHELWSMKVTDTMIHQTLDVRLKQAEAHVMQGLVDMTTWDMAIHKRRFSSPMDLLNYLKRHHPQEDFVFSHGDLTCENIIIDHHHVGLIDLGRMGIADRYQDLALAYRSILYETGDIHMARQLFDRLNIELDETKLDYYLLLDELF